MRQGVKVKCRTWFCFVKSQGLSVNTTLFNQSNLLVCDDTKRHGPLLWGARTCNAEKTDTTGNRHDWDLAVILLWTLRVVLSYVITAIDTVV